MTAKKQVIMTGRSVGKTTSIGLLRDILLAEQVTGCCEAATGFGKIYRDEDTVLTLEEAKDLLLEGGTIEIPNAGAGTYVRFLLSMGFKDIRLHGSTSSVGDWTILFDVPEGPTMQLSQKNRYPRSGFTYGGCREFEGV